MKRHSGFDWVEFIIGILLIVLGIFTFIFPGSMLTSAVVIYGIIAVIMGIADIVVYVKLTHFTGFGPILSLVSGIMSIMCGTLLIANPNIGKWALTILMPIWFIAHCISGLTRAQLVHLQGKRVYYYLTLITNIIGLILGFLIIFSPSLSFLTIRIITYIAAAYFVMSGIERVALAFDSMKQGRR
ncbi:MAG: HdeD family acid-resistance protein [Eubacteriales bacterium]